MCDGGDDDDDDGDDGDDRVRVSGAPCVRW